MIVLSGRSVELVRDAVRQSGNYLVNLRAMVASAVGRLAGQPNALSTCLNEVGELQAALAEVGFGDEATLPDRFAPILATALAQHRREFVRDLEGNRARALAAEQMAALDSAKESLDELLRASWYADCSTIRLPRARDFVATSPTQSGDAKARTRKVDDKFEILFGASEILVDLEILRRECEERCAPLAVVFLDVDGLKKLNETLQETWVDSLVLPPLMRAVERAVFGHGFAYRFGGDEFVLLLPSSDAHVAQAVLMRLQSELAAVKYERLKTPPTVSIGLCVALPDSPLTDRELLHWAAGAKRQAKKTRNCIQLVTAGRSIIFESQPPVEPPSSPTL